MLVSNVPANGAALAMNKDACDHCGHGPVGHGGLAAGHDSLTHGAAGLDGLGHGATSHHDCLGHSAAGHDGLGHGSASHHECLYLGAAGHYNFPYGSASYIWLFVVIFIYLSFRRKWFKYIL